MMETSLTLLLAAVVGFSHAFEADHLVAVSNIVTKRNNTLLAIKDGIYWGLGHTSTIFLIGLIMLVGKATFLNGFFGYLEALVGFMLIGLGVFRLYQFYKPAFSIESLFSSQENHHLAYSIGLIHGIAGSGALILLVMTEIQSTWLSLIYLVIFGLGSIVGMLLAAGMFNLPFSKRLHANRNLRLALVILSSVICISYGAFVVFENI